MCVGTSWKYQLVVFLTYPYAVPFFPLPTENLINSRIEKYIYTSQLSELHTESEPYIWLASKQNFQKKKKKKMQGMFV